MKNIVVFVSGSGSNLQSIINNIENGQISNVRIALVVADRKCYGLERAKNHQIPTKIVERGENFFKELYDVIPEDTSLIVLAGFLSILNSEFCKRWKGKIINIHPSLLPKFGGKGMWGHYVHDAVIAANEKESGATVHFVTTGIDEGEVILQGKVEVLDNETAKSLASKIIKIEHEIYPKAINYILNS